MKKIIAFSGLFTPFLAFAQVPAAGVGTANDLIVWLKSFMSTATVLILAAAVVYFLWNVFGYVMASGDPEKRAEKQSGIIYGVIGIAVMVSIWGLVNFFTSTANLSTGVKSAPGLSL